LTKLQPAVEQLTFLAHSVEVYKSQLETRALQSYRRVVPQQERRLTSVTTCDRSVFHNRVTLTFDLLTFWPHFLSTASGCHGLHRYQLWWQ